MASSGLMEGILLKEHGAGGHWFGQILRDRSRTADDALLVGAAGGQEDAGAGKQNDDERGDPDAFEPLAPHMAIDALSAGSGSAGICASARRRQASLEFVNAHCSPLRPLRRARHVAA